MGTAATVTGFAARVALECGGVSESASAPISFAAGGTFAMVETLAGGQLDTVQTREPGGYPRAGGVSRS